MTQPPPLRLLLVEDQEINRSLIHAIVSRSKDPRVKQATVVEAHDLAQARTAVADGLFDVVLLDVQLPDGNGLALLDDLAATSRARPTVIALTGGVLQHQREEAMRAGCDAFLDKPFRPADLIDLLTQVPPAHGPDGPA